MVLICISERDRCKNRQIIFGKKIDRTEQNGIINKCISQDIVQCVDEDSSPFLIATERDAPRIRWV